MNIGVIGVNHNVAPIEIREKVSFTDIQKIEAINYLLDKEIEEIIILSTCNRSEIYIQSKNIENKIKIVEEFYESFFNLPGVKQYLFTKKDRDAIEHIYKVSAGLDSIVLGEDQILGQVRDAHEFSMQLGASKKKFNKLFREAITVSKDIKTKTKISQQPLSISYIGVRFLEEKLGNLEGKNALVIGIGKMSKLTMKHLEEGKVNTIYVSNRSHGKIKEIENDYKNIVPIQYNDRYKVLNDVDMVISATASPHIIIKADEMPKIERKIYMMDIALPRDIDPDINKLENVELYDIDDLKQIHDKNDQKRKELANIGLGMINESIDEFVEWLDSTNIDPTIESLNERCDEIREDTLDYIFRKINLDNREKKIIEKMMTSALKRLIREPIINLKQTKDKGKREEYMKMVEELFEI
ncbi:MULTISPECIES: glutamyl-tRNA reductase [Romboutsia]|uniref:Glutamyl-tRNA reductase n=1 Tax=Romboutsia hominis TaxID=1507512 RepID=A0A2P2BUR7_9FIRM|nr:MULTISPECIES: glutamyl-tRNA reductase [Romboutsia]MCH1959066.1 glutamyl-tRNA reductase [Romboutsia hominis]MDB8806223.1 glutamyl-tRNA reductase [Romboutsia sp. 1001216sp1]MDB8808903.1 glutamyl-tRNA reductase [Romboutsia sp. 1001216sp1]MDB8811871.1 glutamyl-tRNA reductase [Romboutsia sp. 1001216sp1]MDB8817617.1 glutamyl-tRNA reductase [Romboutsia sp. 1001216sp1]